jgi:hypothetical protein
MDFYDAVDEFLENNQNMSRSDRKKFIENFKKDPNISKHMDTYTDALINAQSRARIAEEELESHQEFTNEVLKCCESNPSPTAPNLSITQPVAVPVEVPVEEEYKPLRILYNKIDSWKIDSWKLAVPAFHRNTGKYQAGAANTVKHTLDQLKDAFKDWIPKNLPNTFTKINISENNQQEWLECAIKLKESLNTYDILLLTVSESVGEDSDYRKNGYYKCVLRNINEPDQFVLRGFILNTNTDEYTLNYRENSKMFSKSRKGWVDRFSMQAEEIYWQELYNILSTL